MLTVQSETLMQVDQLFRHKYTELIADERLNWTCAAVKYFLMRVVMGDRDIRGEKLVEVLQEVKTHWVAAGLPEVLWWRVNHFFVWLESFSQHPVHLLDRELHRMLEQNYVEIQYTVQNLIFNQYRVIRAFDLLLTHALLEPLDAAS
ncbi:hypothetical protein pEaSNUABM11_00239 [Erwinia phage pEa_SNUABM_11]|nr:hypothetical protein pEaSNUABM11_00239 [Erwinia phage pEa_SNUABM_11]